MKFSFAMCFALAMLSFIIIPSYFWMPSHAIKCFVMSDLSSQRCLHHSVYAMLSFSAKSESVYETCYVCMGAIISFVPFWLVIIKGLLLYTISRLLPCLCLLWYVPVACYLIALNFATWCYFCHVQWFLPSLWNCYYLQSCHVLLSMFYWFLEIA